MAEHEKMRARRKIDAAVSALAKEQERLEEIEAVARKQTLATMENHQKALTLFGQTHSDDDHRRASQEEEKRVKRSRKLASVLHLKSEMEGITKTLQTNAERIALKRERAAQALAASKEAMIASGVNPYAEFRRREVEEQTQTELDRLVKRVELGKTQVLEEMKNERARITKADRQSAKAKVVLRWFELLGDVRVCVVGV